MEDSKKIIDFLLIILCISFHTFPANPHQILLNNNQFEDFLPIPEADLSDNTPLFQKGLSYSAWSRDAFISSDSDESLALITQTNTEWIAICLSWVQSNLTSHDIHPDPIRTPSTNSVEYAIKKAHSLGLKVMLKPMVDTLEEERIQGYPTVWRGEIQPSDKWFESYSYFINSFAAIAEQNGVELLCIGCELKATTGEKEKWETIISEVKEHYSGSITYAADWTNYQNIEWWDSLDYIGIDAYFPLTLLDYNPPFTELLNVWTNHANDIEEWISSIEIPLIFTEIGYRSGDGTGMAPSNYWSEMAIDLEEQRDCYEAAFQALWNRSWFYGFYWWTWIFDPTKGGINDSSHTPQNKPAQEVLTKWYSLDRRTAIIDESFTTSEKCGLNEVQIVGFHASWENDGNNVVNAQIWINGTEYITNGTGWITFSSSFDTVGKRYWVVTDFQHPESYIYKITAENPHIIWDTIIISVDFNSFMLGASTVKVRMTHSFDGSVLTGSTTTVNGELCEELEPGVYFTEIVSWSPYQQLKIQTNTINLRDQTWTISTFHVLNITLYLIFFVIVIAILILIKKRQHHISKNQNNKLELY